MTSNLKKGVLSSVLLVGESILKKMVGLVSTLILARVLLPEDFGIIAIATLVIGFIDILSNTGSHQYLLKVEELDADKTNTSFTINIILKGIMAAVMAASAIYIADYYDDPRLPPIIWALTGVFILNTLKNPGVVFLQREQNYLRLVKVSLVAKTLSVCVAVYTALTFQNYWALVYGQASNAILMLIGSYWVHPHRPKLTLVNAKEQWEFSGWIIPQSMFGYVRTQLDTFIVSSSFGQSQLGSYHTMKYISFIPSAHLILPLIQPFLVELRKTKESPNYFAKQFNASFIITMLLALPITLVMFFHHELVTGVLLGPNWIEYSELLGAFALLVPAFVMLNQSMRVLIIFGKTKHIFIYECIAFTILYASLFALGFDDITLFTYLRVAIENLVCSLFLLYVAIKYTSVKNTFSLFLSFLPLSVAGYAAVLMSDISAQLSEQIFMQLMIVSATCFLTFYFVVLIAHLLGFNKLTEWQYLESIILRIIKPIVKKISNVFN
jgi:O-antigen/teichoic acid export membrane protein